MKGLIYKKNKEINTDLEVANANIEKFMEYLKSNYDYDEVSVHHLEKEGDSYNSNIFNDTLDFICICNHGYSENERKLNLQKLINTYYNKLTIVKLSQYYEYHSVNHYLIISHFFDKNNNHKIVVPTKFNAVGLLDIKPISFSSKKVNHDDFKVFYEFKKGHLEGVLEFNISINDRPPILKNFDVETKGIDYKRRAQVIIRRYPEDDNNINYKIEFTLLKNDKIIKQVSHKITDTKFYVCENLNKFLFPLCENEETIKTWDLNPELSHEFMSHDYTKFWDLKMMVEI